MSSAPVPMIAPPGDIESLRARIDRIQGGRRRAKSALAFGIDPLDERLPEGGLSRGVTHEIAGGDQRVGRADVAEHSSVGNGNGLDVGHVAHETGEADKAKSGPPKTQGQCPCPARQLVTQVDSVPGGRGRLHRVYLLSELPACKPGFATASGQ